MVKSRKNNIFKSVTKTSKTVLPVVDKCLKTVGTVAKDVAMSSIPIVEKGVSTVYGTMATGFNLGVKSANTVAKGISKGKHSRKVSRRRKMDSGKSRRRKNRRH
jgi:hypothetical protein